jgi:diguanylate cyclase (GGDEF)-like protein
MTTMSRQARALPRDFVVAAVAASVALLTVTLVVFARPLGSSGDVAVVDVMEVCLAFAGAAGCAVSAVRTRDRLRWAWVYLTVACASWGVGQSIWSAYEVWLGRETPFPSIADIGFLGFVPAAVAAIWLLPSGSGVGDNRRRLLDGLTVTCAVALISWSLVLGPTVRAGGEWFTLVVSVAYPVSDILLLTVALLALAQGTRGRAPLILVSLGMCAMALSDGAFAYLTTTGSFESVSIVDLGWCMAFALMGLGGLIGSDAEQANHTHRAAVVPASVLPYMAPAAVAVLVLTQYFLGRTVDRVSVGLSSLVVGLVLARQYLTVHDNQALARTITSREAELRHQAFYDGLTGLANRPLFINRVTHALELHRRDRRPVSIAFVDLDGFKGINDMLGHAAGDEMLVLVAERLRGAVRSADTLSRLGGDEFALLMEHGDEPATTARALVEALRAPFHLHGRSVTMSASVGVATVGSDKVTITADDLLSRADMAMYAVKRSGRNDFRQYTSNLRLAEGDDATLRQALAEALESRQVRAVFQPIVEVATGEVVGYEALARWSHQGAEVSPHVFVAVAERAGLSAALTTLMLDHACAQLARWSAELGHSRLLVGVNVSALELGDPSLPRRVQAALESHGLAADQLVLEITETALVSDPDAAHAILVSLCRLGVSLSLDDFGTGYNGLAQLIGVPLRSVKLDRHVIADIDTDPSSRRLLEGVMMLMRHLGLRAVAEGVERSEQLEVLRAVGCQAAQGSLLGPPADATDIDVRTTSPQQVSI